MNKSNIISWLNRVATGLVFLAPLTVLVAPLPPFSPVVGLFFFPYISAKTFFFRILVDIVLLLVIALIALDKKYRPQFSPIAIAGLIFVAMIGLADWFGVNAIRSIWSNFERMEGWVTLVHLAGYFVVLISLIKTEKLWVKFFYTNLVVAGVVSLYGLTQTFGWLAIQQGSSRIDGPFGNASYFATYMFFAIGITILLFLGQRHLADPRPKSDYLFYGLPVLLFGLMLYLTGTRGALLGLVVMIILIVIGLLIVHHDRKDRKIQIILSVILGLTLLSVISLWVGRNTSFVQSQPMLARAASSFNLQDRTIESRLTIWQKIVWPGFKERPILGWGQENFIEVFGKYYDPSMHNQEPWFDRTHNTFFDWLIAGGLIGLLSYLSILLAWFWCLVKISKKYLSNGQKVILGSILVGYMFQNLVIFDNLTSYLWLIALLAYVHVLYGLEREKEQSMFKNNFAPKSLVILTTIISIILVLIVTYFANIKPLYANVSLINALQSVGGNDFKGGLDKFRTALAVGTYGDVEIREQLVRSATNLLINQQAPIDLKQVYVNLILEQYDQHFKKYPNDVRSRLVLAGFFGQFGQFSQALELLNQAAVIAPKKQMVFMLRARVYANTKNYSKALEDAKYAFELDQSYLEARMLYADLALGSGDSALAKKLKSGVAVDALSVDEQINYYVEKKDYLKLVELWKIKLDSDPGDIQNYTSFAASLYMVNKKKEAVTVMEQALERFPNWTEKINEIIDQIKAGTVILQ